MELAVAAYRQSFFPLHRDAAHGVRVATARAGNVVGGGDWGANRLVPDAARALAAGRPLVVRHPRSVRPWQHVLEPLSGYLWLAARMANDGGAQLTGAWNFGPPPGERWTVARVAEAVIEAWGAGEWRAEERHDAPHETGTLTLSIERARAVLGWGPAWDAPTAVARAARWYKAWRAGAAGDNFRRCCDDIAAYEAAAAEGGQPWTR
jgi:CDP-glucose 4,6-dehydratase